MNTSSGAPHKAIISLARERGLNGDTAITSSESCGEDGESIYQTTEHELPLPTTVASVTTATAAQNGSGPTRLRSRRGNGRRFSASKLHIEPNNDTRYLDNIVDAVGTHSEDTYPLISSPVVITVESEWLHMMVYYVLTYLLAVDYYIAICPVEAGQYIFSKSPSQRCSHYTISMIAPANSNIAKIPNTAPRTNRNAPRTAVFIAVFPGSSFIIIN
jgi:hypothetical protein